MTEHEHMSKTEFLAFQHDTMNQTEKMKFLEHIGSCNSCADQFASLMSEDLIAAPRQMKANLIKAAKRPDIQLAAKARATSKRMQLFIYSLKVGTATVCALLLLLFTMNFSNITTALDLPMGTSLEMPLSDDNNTSMMTKMRDKMDTISNHMLNFTNNIINGGN